jgi:hypothetical protein
MLKVLMKLRSGLINIAGGSPVLLSYWPVVPLPGNTSQIC